VNTDLDVSAEPVRLIHGSAVPLLRIPEGLPTPFVAIIAMMVLAGLDAGGAVLARRTAQGGSIVLFGAGLLCFAVLFWVYASSLRYAELIPVTFGWIAALQVGLMIIERQRNSAAIPVGHWIAGAAVIALEGYLLFTSRA
jgi:hypothetical protein